MAKHPAPEEKKLDSFNYHSESTRRKRTVFNREQANILKKYFAKIRYPGIEEREKLSRLINVPESRIQVWFQNRRARQRTEPKKWVSEASTSSRTWTCLESVSPSPSLEDNISKQELTVPNKLRCPSQAVEPSQDAGPRSGCSFERRSVASTTEAACSYGCGISRSYPSFSSKTMRPSTELQPCALPRTVSQGSSSQLASSWALPGTQGPENYNSCTSFCGGVKPLLQQGQQRWTLGQVYPGYHPMLFQYAEKPPHQLQQPYLQQHPTSQVQQQTPHQHQWPQVFQGQTQLPTFVKEEEQPNELFPSFKQQELHPIHLSKKTAGLESTLFFPEEHLKAPLGDLAAPQGHLTAPLGDLATSQEHLAPSQGHLATPLENLTVPLGEQPEIPDASTTDLMFLDALSFVLNDNF